MYTSLYIVLFYNLNKTIILSALLVTPILFVKCPTVRDKYQIVPTRPYGNLSPSPASEVFLIFSNPIQ